LNMRIASSSIAFLLLPLSVSAEHGFARVSGAAVTRSTERDRASTRGNIVVPDLRSSGVSAGHWQKPSGTPVADGTNVVDQGPFRLHASEIPRGGEAYLTPTVVAKVAIVLSGMQGLMLNVAPEKCNEMYGLTANENTPFCVFMSRQVGTGLLAFSVTSFLLIMQQVSVYQAVRICDLMFLYEYTRFFLNDGLRTVGFASAVPLSISTAFIAFSFYAVTQSYATKFVQLNCILWGLMGLSTILAPRATLASWSLQPPMNASGVEFSRLFGYYLVACAIQQGALTLGATPLQAFGAGMIVFLLHHLDSLIVQGDYKKFDKRNARLFWVAINSLVGITTLR
jgi:hypothetical protein